MKEVKWERGANGLRYRMVPIDYTVKRPLKKKYGRTEAYVVPPVAPNRDEIAKGNRSWWPRWNFSFSSPAITQAAWDRIFKRKKA